MKKDAMQSPDGRDSGPAVQRALFRLEEALGYLDNTEGVLRNRLVCVCSPEVPTDKEEVKTIHDSIYDVPLAKEIADFATVVRKITGRLNEVIETLEI